MGRPCHSAGPIEGRGRPALLLSLLALSLTGCPPAGSKLPRGCLAQLENLGERRLVSVTVGDQAELALLRQELGLESLLFQNGRAFFAEDASFEGPLRELDYDLRTEVPEEVFRCVVRVRVDPDMGLVATERRLLDIGALVINREPEGGYLVADGSLAVLEDLSEQGFELDAIGAGEPAPRPATVSVDSEDEVRVVTSMPIDLYTVVRDEDGGFVVHCGLFDSQVDELRRRGYEVVLAPPVGEAEP